MRKRKNLPLGRSPLAAGISVKIAILRLFTVEIPRTAALNVPLYIHRQHPARLFTKFSIFSTENLLQK